MNDRQRQERLDLARALLERIAARPEGASCSRLEVAVRNLDEWRGQGYPKQSQMLSDIHQARGVHRPVEATIEAANPVIVDKDTGEEHAIWRPDELEIARAKLDEDLEIATLALKRLEGAGARIDEDLETLTLACKRLEKNVVANSVTAKAPSDPECVLCSGLGRTRRVHAFQRCQWHYDFRRKWVDEEGEGIDAHPELGRMHLDGRDRYITERLVQQYHPTARKATDRIPTD